LITGDRAKWVRPLLLAAGVFAAVNLLSVLFPVAFNTWNERLNDQFISLKNGLPGFAPPYDDVVIHVDLNNTSLRALKDYHPARGHYARGIRNLGAMKVAVQMCDIIFAGETSPDNDRLLVDATRQAREVVFGMAFRLASSPGLADVDENPDARNYLQKTAWKIKASQDTARFYHGVDPLVTWVPLAELSLGMGFLTLAPDPDGVIRRLPLLVRFEDGFYPSFALKAVCDFLKVSPDRILLAPGSITLKDALRRDRAQALDLAIPVDPRGCMRITFAGPWGRMKHYNFSDIYFASDDRESLEAFQYELEGRIALVSDTSTGSADMGQVPIDETYPLSGVHANAVNTILTGSFIREFPVAAAAVVEIILVFAVTALSFHRSALVSAAGVVGLGTLLTATAGLAFLSYNLLAPVVRPLIGTGLTWAALSIWHAVANARKAAEIERARQLAERELEIGRKIQAGFLPASLPVPPGWEIAAYFQPAMQVSGDFYDVFELRAGRFVGIVVADVCDHGVGSALFMALTRSLIRAFALQNVGRLKDNENDPDGWPQALTLEAVRQTNAYISENHGDTGMFATLFFGILDPAAGRLTYVNGGHEPPLLLRCGQPVAYLKTTGLAVGALSDAPYKAESITLQNGDRLFLYTDGVTDAGDNAGVHFSKQRLVGLVAEESVCAQALVDRVVAALKAHVGKGAPADDITLLSVRKT